MNDSRPPSPPVAHVFANVHSPPAEAQPLPDAAHVFLDAPASVRGDTFALLSPSARTSYTRVDVTLGEDPIRMDADATTQDHAEPAEQGAAPQPPQVSLIFLLVTGRRRTMSFEPETTVGRVKELFWNAWPSDWQDDVPPSPSYLRILYLGKILQDEDTLLKIGFPIHVPDATSAASTTSQSSEGPSATIVHLSIRTFAPDTEETPKKKGVRRFRANTTTTEAADAADTAGCCRCTIC